MNELKKQMIAKARTKHSQILPCTACSKLDDCFTIEDKAILFWYNTEDQSTHLMVENL